MAIILITHDLGVVAEIADEIAVMYAGRIVEHATAEEIFHAPQHPYTWGLLKSIPRLDGPRDEELVPISGRPPSLISAPVRVPLPSALPVRPRAAQADRPAAGARARHARPSGRVPAGADVRARIWRGLESGESPADLRREVSESPATGDRHAATRAGAEP